MLSKIAVEKEEHLILPDSLLIVGFVSDRIVLRDGNKLFRWAYRHFDEDEDGEYLLRFRPDS